MTEISLIGLKTCDRCRAARKALESAGRVVAFRDVRDQPPTREEIATWLEAFGEALVNRKSTTWRMLSQDDRTLPAVDLLLANPTLMKRPVILAGGALHLGWGDDSQAALLG